MPAAARPALRDVIVLLGYPAGHELSELAAQRLSEAIAWFEAHARPHVALQRGETLVAAITAGPEVAAEVARLWPDEPDSAWFLDRYAVAVVEALVDAVGADAGDALPPVGPGIDRGLETLPGLIAGLDTPVRCLDGGGLDPVHSVVVVYPLADAPLPWVSDKAKRACADCAFRCGVRRKG